MMNEQKIADAFKGVAEKAAEITPACEPKRTVSFTNTSQLNVHVPTWVWVPIALWFFCKALAIAQHIYYVMTPGGVG